jgi:hypothetical protein
VDEVNELNPKGIVLINKNIFEIVPQLLPPHLKDRLLNKSYIPFPAVGSKSFSVAILKPYFRRFD